MTGARCSCDRTTAQKTLRIIPTGRWWRRCERSTVRARGLLSMVDTSARLPSKSHSCTEMCPSRPTRVSDPGTGAASALPKTADHTAAARSTPTDRYPELNRCFHLMLTTPGLGETSSLQILGELAVIGLTIACDRAPAPRNPSATSALRAPPWLHRPRRPRSAAASRPKPPASKRFSCGPTIPPRLRAGPPGAQLDRRIAE